MSANCPVVTPAIFPVRTRDLLNSCCSWLPLYQAYVRVPTTATRAPIPIVMGFRNPVSFLAFSAFSDNELALSDRESLDSSAASPAPSSCCFMISNRLPQPPNESAICEPCCMKIVNKGIPPARPTAISFNCAGSNRMAFLYCPAEMAPYRISLLT